MPTKVDIPCGVCQGSGKQRIRTINSSANLDPIFGLKPGEEQVTEMPCVWCQGSGKMLPEQAEDLEYERQMWCRCGNLSGSTAFIPDGECPKEGCRVAKHHYHCQDCGKIHQIG